MDSEKGIETLKVWQKAIAFTIYIHEQVLPSLPVDLKWALSMQLRRSAQSIPANIAEGNGRYYYQEGIRFCYIARGSLEESFTYLSLAHELGYLSREVFTKTNNDIQELRRIINGYINYLKKNKRGENEAGSKHRIQEDFIDTTKFLHDEPEYNPELTTQESSDDPNP